MATPDAKKIKFLFQIFCITVKLDDKERLDNEQLGSSDTFPVTNLSVYFINSEQFCDDQTVSYHQV